MTAHLDLLFAGRVFCDLVMSGARVPAIGAETFAEGFTVSPGGSATRAVAGARLGLSTGVVGTVGRDLFGTEVLAQLAAEPGVDVAHVVRHPTAHTAVTVAITNHEDRSFVTYEQAVTAELPEPRTALAVGGCHVGLVEGVPEWVRALRRAGTLVVGGVGWDDAGHWSSQVLDGLADVDVCIPNDVEALAYTRSDDVPAAARRLAERVPVVCVTRGPDGAYALDARTGEVADVRAPVVPAVDPTGAGDVFTAAFMAACQQPWNLATRTAFAVAAASRSVQTPGGAAGAPSRERLAADLRAQADQVRAHGADPGVDWSALLAWAASD